MNGKVGIGTIGRLVEQSDELELVQLLDDGLVVVIGLSGKINIIRLFGQLDDFIKIVTACLQLEIRVETTLEEVCISNYALGLVRVVPKIRGRQFVFKLVEFFSQCWNVKDTS